MILIVPGPIKNEMANFCIFPTRGGDVYKDALLLPEYFVGQIDELESRLIGSVELLYFESYWSLAINLQSFKPLIVNSTTRIH